jgi:hypothetical protein
MTVTRTHKAYMRGFIWLLALVGLALLPGSRTAETEAQPVEVASR